MAKRPALANPAELVILSTQGGEFMYADTLQEYVGDYHVYKNGAVYSDAEYNVKTSKELIKYIAALSNPICQTYLTISRKLFANYQPPVAVFRIMRPEDYEVGFVDRYIIQKINEPHKIWEVDIEQFKSLNRFNLPGLNERIYRRDYIRWRITGAPDYVRDWNSKAVLELEQTIPQVGTRLLTDPLEFARITYNGPIDNRFTAGGQYKNFSGQIYIGLYHIREDGLAYEGPTFVSGVNRQLFPI